MYWVNSDTDIISVYLHLIDDDVCIKVAQKLGILAVHLHLAFLEVVIRYVNKLMSSEEDGIIMSEAVEFPDHVMQRIKRLKVGPEETPIEVITRLLDYYDEDDEIDEDLERRIQHGLEDVDAGRYRPLRDIAKDMGI